MRTEKFHKWIKKEIETEAEALEKQAESNEELSSVRMPDDSYADLMKRIEAMETPAPKHFHIRKRTLLAVALAAVLVAAVGAGASGAKLFVPKVENATEDGEFNVRIITGEREELSEITEEEAYEAIEERLGILALRLGYKPQGMELEKVYIDEVMGEAQMEFYYKDHVFTIYENKQNDNASYHTQFDGVVIDRVNIFQNDQAVDILEIEGGSNGVFRAMQIEQGNAYYYVACNFDIDEFKEIIQGIFFKSV